MRLPVRTTRSSVGDEPGAQLGTALPPVRPRLLPLSPELLAKMLSLIEERVVGHAATIAAPPPPVKTGYGEELPCVC